jgi:hypothetical protein
MVSSTRRARCLLVACLVVVALLVFAAPFVTGQEKEPAGSQERLRALLIQRRDVLRRLVPTQRKMMELGLRDPAELRFALLELHKAEIDLCATQAERLEVQQRLIEAIEGQEHHIRAQVEVGVMQGWQAQKARAVTLQAQIGLERLRLGQRPPN